MRSRSGRDVKSWAPSPAWLLSIHGQHQIVCAHLRYYALWDARSPFQDVQKRPLRPFELLVIPCLIPTSQHAVLCLIILGKLVNTPPFGALLNVWDFKQGSWHSAQPSPRVLHALPLLLLIVSIDSIELHETGAKSQVESQDWISLDQRMSMMMDLLAYDVPDISF